MLHKFELFQKDKEEKDKYNKDYSQTTLESSAAEVEKRLQNGCECKVSCFQGFSAEMVYKHRLNIAELTKNEQDFYVMGIVRAVLMDPSDRGAKRQRKRSSYSYHGKKVCLYAFLYLENITIYQLKKIRSHVMKHGVVVGLVHHSSLQLTQTFYHFRLSSMETLTRFHTTLFHLISTNVSRTFFAFTFTSTSSTRTSQLFSTSRSRECIRSIKSTTKKPISSWATRHSEHSSRSNFRKSGCSCQNPIRRALINKSN